VLGIAGLMGSGRTEIARAIFGLDRPDAGRVYVSGQLANIRSPRDAIRHGIGFVTEDRKREGLVLGRSVLENIVLSVVRHEGRLGGIARRRERELATRYIGRLRIVTPSPDEIVANLSGGNQQKTVLAKWLAARVDVLILDEPTRGIDIGAKQEIAALVRGLSADGVAVILISSELPEIVALAHRTLVLRRGRICGEFTRGETSAERLLACAMGT
jgi:ABC-type sugar transport system ATPase subunit